LSWIPISNARSSSVEPERLAAVEDVCDDVADMGAADALGVDLVAEANVAGLRVGTP